MAIAFGKGNFGLLSLLCEKSCEMEFEGETPMTVLLFKKVLSRNLSETGTIESSFTLSSGTNSEGRYKG